MSLRDTKERHKKLLYFTFSHKSETPLPSPFFDHLSFFSDKDFFDWARPPPPLNEKNGKKLSFWSKMVKKNSVFGQKSSKKTLVFGRKWSKKS